MRNPEIVIKHCARASHEVLRSYHIAAGEKHGEPAWEHWEDTSEGYQMGAEARVREMILGPTPLISEKRSVADILCYTTVFALAKAMNSGFSTVQDEEAPADECGDVE